MGLLQSGSRLIEKKRGGGAADPFADNVVLFLKADQSSLITNTTTSANFTVPAVNSTVTVDVISSAWAAANRAIRIGNGAGNYIVTNVYSGTQITIMNCGGNDNAAPGTTINSGATVALSIIDSSPTPKILNAFGNIQLSTAQSKYNGSSIYFDGNGGHLTIDASSDFAFDGDFTLEYWIYFNNFQQDFFDSDAIYDGRPDSVNGDYLVSSATASTKKIVFSLRSDSLQTTTAFNLNQWYHVALSRNSGTVRLFVNGIVEDTQNYNINLLASGTLKIGANAFRFSANGLWLWAYIGRFRITKGVARYTTNFNPEETYLN